VSPLATGSVTSLMTLSFGATPISQALTVPVSPLTMMLTVPSSVSYAVQPSVTLNAQQGNSSVNGCLVLSFAASTSPAVDDPTIALALSNSFFTASGTASRAATFTLPSGSGTVTQGATVSLGSTAGTVTLSVYAIAPSAACPPPSGTTALNTQQFSIAPAPPVLQNNVTLTSSGDTLTVTVTGFSNTHDLSSAIFTFTAAPGSAIQSGDGSLTTNISSLAAPYFASSATTGGAFVYTQTFNLTASAGDIASVAVSLTNSAGQTTTPVSGSQGP